MARKLKIYIAGPMRGYRAFNFPAFRKATKRFRDAGYRVVSPAEMDEELWGTVKEIHKVMKKRGEEAYNECMHRDIKAILGCGGIALLPGWQHSRGAKTELVVAKALGLKIFDAITLQQINPVCMPIADASVIEGMVKE